MSVAVPISKTSLASLPIKQFRLSHRAFRTLGNSPVQKRRPATEYRLDTWTIIGLRPSPAVATFGAAIAIGTTVVLMQGLHVNSHK